MDIEDQFCLGHLLFKERKCKSCGKVKDLLGDFYLTRKDRATVASAYSYECKECTIKRIVASRMTNRVLDKWEYPDW
jgi:predicted nucleic acid-binding Zn ribbon protein